MKQQSQTLRRLLISTVVLGGLTLSQQVTAMADAPAATTSAAATSMATNQIGVPDEPKLQSRTTMDSNLTADTANASATPQQTETAPTDSTTPALTSEEPEAKSGQQGEVVEAAAVPAETPSTETESKTVTQVDATPQAAATSRLILGLTVDTTPTTTTSADGSIHVTNTTGQVGDIQNVYAIADFNEVRNQKGQQVMDGSAIANGSMAYSVMRALGDDTRLVMSYDQTQKTTTFSFVDGAGKLLKDIDGNPLAFNFTGDTRTPTQQRQLNDDQYLALNYGGGNVDLNFGWADIYNDEFTGFDWEPGELLSIPNDFTVPVNYVDADTGEAILPSQTMQLQTGSQYEATALPAPDGYELVGTLKNGETVIAGQRLNDVQLNKGATTVTGTIQNDLDTNFLADYYLKRYLAIGSSYHLTLQDYGLSTDISPIDLQVTRLNQAGDVELIYTDLTGQQTSSIIRHNATVTVDNPNDFWAVHPDGGPANNLRSIHNTMQLAAPETITFVYRKKGTQQGQAVTVSYVDEQQHALAQNDQLTGVVGATYETMAKDLTGYELVSTVGDATGFFNQTAQSVQYIYRAVPSGTETTDILGVPVTITVVQKTSDDGAITVTTREASVGTIDHVYAIADFNEVRSIDGQKVMTGTAIANSNIGGWVSENLPTGVDTRLILAYDPATRVTTFALTDKTGNVLKQSTDEHQLADTAVGAPNQDVKLTFSPTDMADGKPVQRIVRVGNLYMSVTYGGDNLDLNFADAVQLMDDNWQPTDQYYLDWNPGMLFSMPNQMQVTVRYVDFDTGKEIMVPGTLDVSTGNTYVTEAKTIDGYRLMGKLVAGMPVEPDTKVDTRVIEQGIVSSDGIYTPDFDASLLADYSLMRHLAVGDSYQAILQDYVFADNGWNASSMSRLPIQLKVTRLNEAGDVQLTLTDLTSGDIQTKVIAHGETDIYSNVNDFWHDSELDPQGPGFTVRTFRNALNLEQSAEVVYVYRAVGQPGGGIHVWEKVQVPDDAPHVTPEDYYDHTKKGQPGGGIHVWEKVQVPDDAPHVMPEDYYDNTKPGKPGDGIHIWEKDQVPDTAPHVESKTDETPWVSINPETGTPDAPKNTQIETQQAKRDGDEPTQLITTEHYAASVNENVTTQSATSAVGGKVANQQGTGNANAKQATLPQTDETATEHLSLWGLLLAMLTGLGAVANSERRRQR